MSGLTYSVANAMTVRPRSALDLGLLVTVCMLIGLGVVMVASASMGVAENTYNDAYHLMVRQLVYVAIGAVMAFATFQIPLRVWERASLGLLLLALLILVLVLVPGLGRKVNGATRWIYFGPIALQVSEFAKLLIFLYMAGYLVRHAEGVRSSFSGFLKPMLVVGFAAMLLLMEPDFGAAVVVFSVTIGMLFIAGARMSQFVAMVGIAVVGFVYLAFTSDYRLRRITSFMDPWADPLDSGFQLTQSLIAIGSGSWHGVGLGASVQKLFYLPEAHNDFLFAILGEELGLIGIGAVILLYSYFLWRAFSIGAAAERAGNLFGGYIAFGIGLWVGIQACVNMGVTMGVLPTKGLTLPLMSAGGSSMLSMCAAVGILMRVHRELHDYSLRGGSVGKLAGGAI